MEPSLCLVRCVPKWVPSAQTACCFLIVSGRSNLWVGVHVCVTLWRLLNVSDVTFSLKLMWNYLQNKAWVPFLIHFKYVCAFSFSQGSLWTTAAEATASPSQKCVRSCRTPWLRCSLSPPTAATSQAPTGTVSCSTPQPSPLFTWACSAS